MSDYNIRRYQVSDGRRVEEPFTLQTRAQRLKDIARAIQCLRDIKDGKENVLYDPLHDEHIPVNEIEARTGHGIEERLNVAMGHLEQHSTLFWGA
jgi:hypothetical protein